MSTQQDLPYPLDPFGTMHALRDTNLATWSKLMIDLVNSEGYSQATSQWLDTYMTISQPFKRVIETTMTQILTGLQMPLRTDVISLAERLTNLEMRLDDQDAKLDDILRTLLALSAANHAVDAAAVTPTPVTHAVRAKENGTGASHTSQTGSTHKKAKGGH